MDKNKIDSIINEIDLFILKETEVDLKVLCEKRKHKNDALSFVFRGLILNIKKFDGGIIPCKTLNIII